MQEENKTVEQNEPAQGAAFTQFDAFDAQSDGEIAHNKKKTKVILICVAGALLIAVLAAVCILFGQGGITIKKSGYAENTSIEARMSDDGTAYIPLYDGTIITINEEVESATLTKDRKHIIVLLEDGSLYVTDKGLTEKKVIDEKCEAVSYVRDDGFFYTDNKGFLYRVLLSDYSSVCLGEDVTYVVADNNTTALFATDDGTIYTIANNVADKTKVGTYSDLIELEAISDSGQISIWVTEEDDTQTIILNDGDNKTILGEIDSDFSITFAYFSKDQNTVVITNSNSENMWVKTADADPLTVKLGSTPAIPVIYTSNGLLSDDTADDITSFYISTVGDSGTNLYCVSMDGERERILSKVHDYFIAGGKIFYTDEDLTLYCADIGSAEVSNETKISSNVDVLYLTSNGKYLYYIKNYEGGMGTLYCYSVGDAEPVKIASDVACYTLSIDGWGSGWVYAVYSTDGDTVYFMQDVEDIDGTYSSHGTLIKWSYGDDDTEKISSEVVLNSVSSSLGSGDVDPTSFMFMKYSSVDAYENIFVNWMFYDGKESTKIVSDVIER